MMVVWVPPISTASLMRRSRPPRPNCGILVSLPISIRPRPVGLVSTGLLSPVFERRVGLRVALLELRALGRHHEVLRLQLAAEFGEDALKKQRATVPRDLRDHAALELWPGDRHDQFLLGLLLGCSRQRHRKEKQECHGGTITRVRARQSPVVGDTAEPG